jgi:hypothetical protein
MTSILSVRLQPAAEYTTISSRVNRHEETEETVVGTHDRGVRLRRGAAQEASGTTPIGLSLPAPSESVMPMRRERASSRPGSGSRK